MTTLTVHFLLLTSLYCGNVESLIGLRPPSATYKPRPTHTVRPTHTGPRSRPIIHNNKVSNGHSTAEDVKLFILQRSRPHSPVTQEVLEKVAALQKIPPDVGPKSKGSGGVCKPSSVLKCTIRFLKDYLRNNTTLCQHIKDLESCILDKTDTCSPVATRQIYLILNNVKSLVPNSGRHACDMVTPTQAKPQEERLNYSPCCVVNLMECMTRTYRLLLQNRKSCDAITDFTSCSSFSFRSYDSQPAEKIFQSIMTLTRTCIHSRKPYET